MYSKLFSKLLLAVSILLMAGGAFGAEGVIEGRVIDASTKEPLPGANVVIAGTTIGDATDETGYFRIENVPAGTQRLQVFFVGYKEKIISDVLVTAAKTMVMDITLQPQAFEGEEIVVSAGYFGNEESKPRPSLLSLSREEIRRFPGGFEDVVRTVSTLPGVAINTAGGRNDLLVRGGGPSENLYIVNNIAVPNINHFGTQGTSSGSLSFINLDFVQNVDFSTGGFPARYGDKMSSVLTLELAEGRSDRFGGKALVSATQFGLNLEGPMVGDGSFIFSARQSYLDLIFKAAGLPFIPTYTDFNFLGTWRMENGDKLTVLGLAALDRVERDQSSLENRTTNAGILDNTQNQLISGIDYRHLYKSGYFDLTMNLNANQYRFEQVDENEETWFESEADEYEVGLKLQNYYAIDRRLGLYSGVVYKNVSYSNEIFFADTVYDRSGNRVPRSSIGAPGITNVDVSSAKYAAFLETEWQPYSGVVINGGLRADYFEFLDEPTYIAPRLSAKWNLTSKWAVSASAGIYYQSPSYVWVSNPANRDLKALQNQMAVLGLSYLWREDTRVTLETFYKQYSDLPTGTIPGVSDYLVITNTGTGFGGREDDFQSFGYFPLVSEGSGRAWGWEFLLQKRASEIPLYGQFSFSWGKALFEAGNGREYPGQYDQRYIMNLAGGYIFSPKWETSAKLRVFSGIPYTPVYRPSENPVTVGEIQNLPEEYLSERLDASWTLDLRVDRTFLFERYTIIAFIDIQNVFDVKVPQRPNYDFFEDEITTTSSIGVLPSIGISFEF